MKKQVLETNAFKNQSVFFERQERCERLDARVTEADFDADDF
jgi:hypothetical protein